MIEYEYFMQKNIICVMKHHPTAILSKNAFWLALQFTMMMQISTISSIVKADVPESRVRFSMMRYFVLEK